MSGYGVVHRVTVYSGTSSSVQLFRVHSQAGLANPYLSDVQHTGRRIYVPDCTADPGQLQFRILDKRTDASDQQARTFTALFQTAEGRIATRTSRVEYDVSDDGGVTFQREFTGRVRDVKQPNKTELLFTVDDARVDELNEMFDGTIPTVDWAYPASMLPIGIFTTKTPDRYGPWEDVEGLEWQCSIQGSSSPSAEYYLLSPVPKAPWFMFTDALREQSSYTDFDKASGWHYAPDIKARFVPNGGDPVWLSITPAYYSRSEFPDGKLRAITADDNEPPIVATVGVASITSRGDGAMPSIGTAGTANIYSVAPPTERTPLHIGVGTAASGVHWATLVSGIAHGKLGGTGFTIDYPRFNTLISDGTQPRLRYRITKGPVYPSQWLEENVWPLVGYAPAVTASGALYPVTYDPPSSLPTLEFDETNTLTAFWEHSRTTQYNRVRIETVREAQVVLQTRVASEYAAAGTSVAVDLLEEFDGDRVVVEKDPDTRRRQFELKATGFRPAADDTIGTNEARSFARARAESILDRFLDGPQYVNLTARRVAATRNAMVGDNALVSVPWLVDVETGRRGGTRVMFITEKAVNPDGTYNFRLLDNGPDQFVDAPTINSLAPATNDTKHALALSITPPAMPARAVVEIATVASGTAEPSSTSSLWVPVVSVSGTGAQSVVIAGLPSRRRHWVRAIGRGPGQLPSAYTSAANAHTAAISPPIIIDTTISGSAVTLAWTVGDATYGVRPLVSTAGSGVADGSLARWLSNPLPAGSSRFTFQDLGDTASVTTGIQHVDVYGGDSTVAKAGLQTGNSSKLTPPRQLTILQGRGDVEPGQWRDPKAGYGNEIQWSVTEPYANVVLHYDTDSNFTAPTAVSGILSDRVKLQFPLDDTTRYFRTYHQQEGFGVSVASETVFAKPVALRQDASLADGFAGGYAFLSLNGSNNVVINVGTGDPDTERFYYTVNSGIGFDEPDTTDNYVDVAFMPYSAAVSPTLTLPAGGSAYMWGKFWNKIKGFGQGVKHHLTRPNPAQFVPSIEAVPSQTGGTGYMTLVINDPNNRVTATAFDGNTSADYTPASDPANWSVYDNSAPYTLQHSVNMVGKHNALIVWGVRYTDENGANKWIKGSHSYDADHIAEFTGLQIGFGDDGTVILSWQGDEDFARGYANITVSDAGTDPSTPTAISKDSTLTGRSGTVTTSKTAEVGQYVSVRAVGENSAGEVNAEVFYAKRRRGDSEFVPPRFRVRASRSGSTVTITINGEDHSKSMTAWDFSYSFPNGSGGYSTATNSTSWTTNGWSAGTRTWTSTLELTIPPGVNGEFTFRASYYDEKGVGREKGGVVPLQNIDQVNKTIRIPAAAFSPADYQDSWDKHAGTGWYITPGQTGAHPVYSYYAVVAPVLMPDAVEIDNVRAYGRRSASGDYLEVGLWQGNTSGAGRIGTGCSFGTGTSDSVVSDAANPINYTLDYSGNWFWANCYFKSSSAADDARLKYVEVDYTAYSYEATF